MYDIDLNAGYGSPAGAAPQSAAELASALAEAASRNQSIQVAGNGTKRNWGGPLDFTAIELTTRKLGRILQYEPADLTISVEAGISYRELTETLARNHQMIPLDPPYAATATIGGILAANCSGPRRRQFGSARDLVIGMQFATLEGKLVQTGGMVVKNVAGLDMGKLLIGSYGTLAVITAANFKLTPMPEQEETLLLGFDDAEKAATYRDKLLQGVLHPAAIDLLNPQMAARFGMQDYVLALQFGGNSASVERCRREIGGERGAADFWPRVREITTQFPGGVVVRISCKLTQMAAVFATLRCPAVGRAGTGVIYACFERESDALAWLKIQGPQVLWVVESAPAGFRQRELLWPASGSDFAMMKKIKDMFDPRHLLNRGRLFRAL